MMPWINRVKQNGWNNRLLSLLDVIEPFAPLVGQSLLAVQPIARLWDAHGAVQELAQLLEEPDGVQYLREQLRDE